MAGQLCDHFNAFPIAVVAVAMPSLSNHPVGSEASFFSQVIILCSHALRVRAGLMNQRSARLPIPGRGIGLHPGPTLHFTQTADLSHQPF